MAETVVDRPELSVVIPAFNESGNVSPMYERLIAALDDHVNGLEIVFVDDGSVDDTWNRVVDLAQGDARVRGVRFARNFGHQAALTAGVDAARGRAVVIIDADLQDPPEVIPAMVEKWRAGHEVVYGQREEREGETWFKKATAAVFYRTLRAITNVDIPVDTGDHTGDTKYPLRKMTRFALDGITSFSFLPLRVATVAGFTVSLLSFLYIVVVIVLKVLGINWPGYTSMMASILFLGGVQLVMIGVLGEYVARVFDEVKRRPLYLVGESTDESMDVTPPERPSS
jgi:dolichol-phosphate mannosyltransferase